MDGRRFDKTTQGHEEITQGRKTLRGKLRTVLFLVDTSKTADTIQQQIQSIGAPPDALAQLEAAGYIRAVASPGAGPAARAPIVPVPTALAPTEPAPTALAPTEPAPTESESSSESSDALKTFRAAKALMNETVVDAIGIRAFVFTRRMERCATLADLEALLPAYAAALSKKLDTSAVNALVERVKELASAGRS
jgi:hypothetical protein